MNTCLHAPVARRAFTLIELLTVIAIIGILAAIIIPTVGKVRSTARKAQCASNMRQWGNAVQLFAADYKGFVALFNNLGGTQTSQDDGAPQFDPKIYNRYFSTKSMIAPNGTSVTAQEAMSRCPTAPSDTADTNYLRRCYGFSRPSGYVALPRRNFGLLEAGTISSYNLNQAVAPSKMALMFELAPGNDGATVNNANELETKVRPIQIDESKLRHGGVTNVLFLDGHVETMGASQTDYALTENKAKIENWFRLK